MVVEAAAARLAAAGRALRQFFCCARPAAAGPGEEEGGKHPDGEDGEAATGAAGGYLAAATAEGPGLCRHSDNYHHNHDKQTTSAQRAGSQQAQNMHGTAFQTQQHLPLQQNHHQTPDTCQTQDQMPSLSRSQKRTQQRKSCRVPSGKGATSSSGNGPVLAVKKENNSVAPGTFVVANVDVDVDDDDDNGDDVGGATAALDMDDYFANKENMAPVDEAEVAGVSAALGQLKFGGGGRDEVARQPCAALKMAAAGGDGGGGVAVVDEDPAAVREREQNLRFIDEALEMARLALRTNETPVGCVLVHDGRIIAKGMNATNVTRNGTRHAELMAISALLSVKSSTGPRTTSLRPRQPREAPSQPQQKPQEQQEQPSLPLSSTEPGSSSSSSSSPASSPVADSSSSSVETRCGHVDKVNGDMAASTGESTELALGVAPSEANAPASEAAPAPAPDEGNEDGSKGHLYPYGQKFVDDDRIDPRILRDSVLYVTVEPCVMCASLLRQFGIRKVYFGAVNDKFGGTGGVFSIHANSLPVDADGCPASSAHPLPQPPRPQPQLPDSSGTLGTSYPPGGGDGGNVERGYEIEGGWGRDEAVGLLRRFYVQENGRAPVPRKKEGRAARLAAMNGQNADFCATDAAEDGGVKSVENMDGTIHGDVADLTGVSAATEMATPFATMEGHGRNEDDDHGDDLDAHHEEHRQYSDDDDDDDDEAGDNGKENISPDEDEDPLDDENDASACSSSGNEDDADFYLGLAERSRRRANYAAL